MLKSSYNQENLPGRGLMVKFFFRSSTSPVPRGISLLLLFTLFSIGSGTEIWPILNYPMFACRSDEAWIVPGSLRNDRFVPAPKASFSAMDHFSWLETINNYDRRGEIEKRDRLMRALVEKLRSQGVDTQMWRVKVSSLTELDAIHALEPVYY